MFLKDKSVVVTGGTGSLGKVLVRRLLTGEIGLPRQITVFSRDEAKQHQMRLAFQRKRRATDEVIYHNFEQLLQFRIGDVRDPHSVSTVLRDADAVFNAAALKQVPNCEYFPAGVLMVKVVELEGSRLEAAGVKTDPPSRPCQLWPVPHTWRLPSLYCTTSSSWNTPRCDV